jgi:Protein of unknown function (DUF1566)
MTTFEFLPRLVFSALLLASLPAQAVFTKPWNLVNSDAQATDTDTRLVWRRCAECQTFSAGQCTGAAQLYTHEQALKLAQAQAALGWRLPNERELLRIAERSERNPAINFKVFPSTPSALFWSSTPAVQQTGFARAVDFSSGSLTSRNRSERAHVRMVRISPGAANLPEVDFNKPF